MKYILKCVNISHDFDFIISKACADDAKHIVEFLNKVAGETDFLTFGINEFPFSVSEERKQISACLEYNKDLMLIAKVGNELVSQLFLQRSNKPKLAHIGDVGISVSKKFWGKSIGKHMMLVAIEWAQQHNITKIQLQVRTDNDKAVRLYQRLGFKIEGEITRAMKINNIYFDDYIMGLEL